MPFVVVHMYQGRSVADKRALTKAITDAMVTHAHASPDHLHVVIQEYQRENWARAGVLAVDAAARSDGDHSAGHPAGQEPS